MEVDLHVSAKESEESRHSGGLDLTVISGIEVLPSLVEILCKILLCLSSLESEMCIDDLIGGLLGVHLLEDELTSWLSFWGGELEGILVNHGVHELVSSVWVLCGSGLESLWDLSVIVAKTFSSDEIVVVGLESWMWVLFVPGGGDTITISSNVNILLLIGRRGAA